MSEDDHIAVKIDGVLYVKLEDAKKLRAELDRIARERDEARAEIERLRGALYRTGWRDGVIEMTRRARAVLAPATPPAHEQEQQRDG
jgi:cell division protein FtsB